MAGAADVADDAGEPAAGGSRGVAARVCGRVCAQERRAYPDGTLRVYAQPAVSGVDDDCVRFRGGGVELGDSGGAGGFVCGDLSADDPVGGGVSAGALRGVRRVCEERAAAAAPADGCTTAEAVGKVFA